MKHTKVLVAVTALLALPVLGNAQESLSGKRPLAQQIKGTVIGNGFNEIEPLYLAKKGPASPPAKSPAKPISGAPTLTKIRKYAKKFGRTVEPGESIGIDGANFGTTQGSSVLHVGKWTFGSGSPEIEFWSDNEIRVKIPNCECTLFEGKSLKKQKVWVTTKNTDSNAKKLSLHKPTSCS